MTFLLCIHVQVLNISFHVIATKFLSTDTRVIRKVEEKKGPVAINCILERNRKPNLPLAISLSFFPPITPPIHILILANLLYIPTNIYINSLPSACSPVLRSNTMRGIRVKKHDPFIPTNHQECTPPPHHHTQTPERRKYHIYPTLHPTILWKRLILLSPSVSTPVRSTVVATAMYRSPRCSQLCPHAEVASRPYGGYTGRARPSGSPRMPRDKLGSVSRGITRGGPLVLQVEK